MLQKAPGGKLPPVARPAATVVAAAEACLPGTGASSPGSLLSTLPPLSARFLPKDAKNDEANDATSCAESGPQLRERSHD